MPRSSQPEPSGLRSSLYIPKPKALIYTETLYLPVEKLQRPRLSMLNRETNVFTVPTSWYASNAGKERFDSAGSKVRRTLLKDDLLYT